MNRKYVASLIFVIISGPAFAQVNLRAPNPLGRPQPPQEMAPPVPNDGPAAGGRMARPGQPMPTPIPGGAVMAGAASGFDGGDAQVKRLESVRKAVAELKLDLVLHNGRSAVLQDLVNPGVVNPSQNASNPNQAMVAPIPGQAPLTSSGAQAANVSSARSRGRTYLVSDGSTVVLDGGIALIARVNDAGVILYYGAESPENAVFSAGVTAQYVSSPYAPASNQLEKPDTTYARSIFPWNRSTVSTTNGTTQSNTGMGVNGVNNGALQNTQPQQQVQGLQ